MRSNPIRTVFLIGNALAPAFRSLGLEVRFWRPGVNAEWVPLLDVAEHLERMGFAPDLIVQEESLGARTVLTGLERFDVPKIFWALDAHLNLWWHKDYARLFDGVATPHKSLFSNEDFSRPVLHLPFPAPELPFVPHSGRSVPVGFVGRLTEARPVRTRLVAHLRDRYGATILSDVPPAEMLAMYQNVRIAPNEAICRELNFRVFEAAGAGAVVVSQDSGEDLAAVFEPDREIFLYDDVLELDERLDRLLHDPRAAQVAAHKAWERVKAEHLAVHRVRALLAFAESLPRRAATGREADSARMLVLIALVRSKRLEIPTDRVRTLLGGLAPDRRTFGPLIRLFAETGFDEQARTLAFCVAASPLTVEYADAALAASLYFLKGGSFAQALAVYDRLPCKTTARPPESPAELAKAWAEACVRQGRVIDVGFPTGPEWIPRAAADCLRLALDLGADPGPVRRRLAELFARVRGLEALELAARIELEKISPKAHLKDALALGRAHLRTVDREAGLLAVLDGLETAARQGRRDRFDSALERIDQKGYIRRALGA